MKNTRDIDLLVIEKVMGWQYDRARAFSPSLVLSNLWEMEEYVLEDAARAVRYGEELAREVFPDGWEKKSASEVAVAFAHAAPELRCRAALRACGVSNDQINAPRENRS